MRKNLCVFIGLLASFATELKAQVQSPRTYEDSVRQFLKDWLVTGDRAGLTTTTKSVFDNAIFLNTKLDSNIVGRYQFDHITTVYKLDYNTHTNDNPYNAVMDSIVLSLKEVRYILSKMHNALIPKWTSDLLPSKTVITQENIERLNLSYYSVSNKLKQIYDKWENDYDKIKKDPVYTEYKQMQDSSYYRNAYLKLCNPVFLRNGTYAAMYFHHFAPPMFIGYELAIYKKEGGHWRYFGYIFHGDIN